MAYSTRDKLYKGRSLLFQTQLRAYNCTMALSTLIKLGSALALTTGTADVLLGSKMLENGGPFPVETQPQIFADSQIRFLGGMWAGWGATLWWISNDIENRQVPLAIFGAFFVFGGLGRAISGARYGFKPGMLLPFTIIEVVTPPAVWLLGNWQN